MFWGTADQIRKYALRAAFGALICVGLVDTSFAQEPPLGVQRAGALPGPTIGCDPLGANVYATVGGGTSGVAGNGSPGVGAGANGGAGNVGGAVIANTSSNTNPAGNSNLGGNVPLYGTDLSGNFPLYSTPDLGGGAPLYSTATPGINAPLYSNTSLSNYPGLVGARSNAVNNAPLRCKSGIPVGEWLLYPSLRAYSLYSNNLFLTSTGPTKVVGFGATPRLSAQWTDGIHTTTISGNIDAQYYPTDTPINVLNSDVNIAQKYSPLPDLTFTAVGDFTHQTLQSGLTNSIPTSVTSLPATPTLLPNGDIELPNGNIVAPNGQIVGNVNQALASSGTTLINPYNQYTATGSATKIFNNAILTLSASAASTDYEKPQGSGAGAFSSFKTATFNEGGSVGIGPLLYLYSNGSYSMRNEDVSINPNSHAYRVIGGIGTRQIGLFRASAYFGYQGSETEGSGSAGGTVYGGKVSYFPTLAWTINARFDQTNNFSSQTVASTQAVTLPTNIPVQIATSSSTLVSTPSLQTTYQITPQWTVLGEASYSRIAYVGSPALTQAYFASVTLSYEIWRNMSLAGQYQFSDIVSNVPGSSAERSLIMLSAEYRF